MKTLRIRIDFPNFPYPPRGGSPQVVFDQVCALSSMGHCVELVIWKDSAEEVEKKRNSEEIQPFPENVRAKDIEIILAPPRKNGKKICRGKGYSNS